MLDAFSFHSLVGGTLHGDLISVALRVVLSRNEFK